ncbi:hypothetical protein [Rhizobium leguminosarum]|uniref:hypothetical protein n=1 Tax=Rhizobium leguminosarum TaxID=384 RepID=UPI0014417D1B|nr:hypothetical protein [Rhizobium leguminosarum]
MNTPASFSAIEKRGTPFLGRRDTPGFASLAVTLASASVLFSTFTCTSSELGFVPVTTTLPNFTLLERELPEVRIVSVDAAPVTRFLDVVFAITGKIAIL